MQSPEETFFGNQILVIICLWDYVKQFLNRIILTCLK